MSDDEDKTEEAMFVVVVLAFGSMLMARDDDEFPKRERVWVLHDTFSSMVFFCCAVVCRNVVRKSIYFEAP